MLSYGKTNTQMKAEVVQTGSGEPCAVKTADSLFLWGRGDYYGVIHSTAKGPNLIHCGNTRAAPFSRVLLLLLGIYDLGLFCFKAWQPVPDCTDHTWLLQFLTPELMDLCFVLQIQLTLQQHCIAHEKSHLKKIHRFLAANIQKLRKTQQHPKFEIYQTSAEI